MEPKTRGLQLFNISGFQNGIYLLKVVMDGQAIS